jgi:alpha-L-fucosidase 2
MRLTLRARDLLSATVAAVMVSATLLAVTARPAMADSVTANQAWRIVQQYSGVWTSPPSVLTSGETTDAPMMGNGDVGVAVGGSISNQTFYLGKNDFFSSTSHAIKPLGRIVVAAAGLTGASYHVVQDIAHARVTGTYTLGSQTLTAVSWVSATENLLVTAFTLTGGSAQSIGITFQTGAGGTPTVSTTGNDLDADVVADTGASGDPHARIAARTIGQTQSISGNKLTLTIQPGTTSTLVAAIESSIDTSGYQATADSMVGTLAQTDVNNLLTSHTSWWQSYWSQSYVEIPDKSIEKSWYGSLYLLGCISRAGKYAPGLWGNWIPQTSMNWNGDYHTNYNYEAAFYPALTTNHVAQMSAYDQPVLDYQSAAQTMASQNGFTGVLYPVGISPKGTSADTNLHNQKSDAANLASDMVMRFEYTDDTSYANTVYPWLKQVGLFWQNYLSVDSGGTYHIINDAPHEDQAYPQTDSGMSLGLVHLLFQGLIDMSAALGVDATTRATWQTIETHLAPLPTETLNSQTILRETATGSDFVNDGNDIDSQSIYPGSMIGLDSSSTLRQEGQNTIAALTNAWNGGNAPATFYAAAARVGYNASTILTNLHDEATNQSYNNMAIHHNGGGVENLNVTTSGLDEMLLQSFQKDIKVFADWPANTNAKFGDLLAYGDFLISASMSGNAVQYVRAVSQHGGSFVFTNPWLGQSVEVYRNGTDTGTVSGSTITIATSANDTLDLAPAGTSLATINTELTQPLSTGGGTSGTFSSGLESGQPQPTWSDTVDTTGGGISGVGELCCGLTGPEAGVRTGETSHTGTASLMYSGSAQGGTSTHAYLKVFDLSGAPLAIGTSKTLSYWVYPQSSATTPYVSAGSTNSECVAIDMIFTDNSTLRDSGAVDQNGNQIHPAHQCGHLSLDTWNHVTVNLATHDSNKQINRILVGFDDPGATGGYRGYIDDITIS